MADAPALWRVEVRVPEAAVAAIEDLLAGHCMAVSTFAVGGAGDPPIWRIEGFMGRAPDRDALNARVAEAAEGLGPPLPGLVVERLAPRDWLAENRARFPPFSVGRYFIHGSHVRSRPPAGAVPLLLDAGAAFGSGEHATTRACLGIVDRLAKARRFRRPLDVGTGSGILALAMARTWRVPVVATDIDPAAVAVAGRNARLNGVQGLVRVVRGAGLDVAAVRAGRPFDLITANILARPLAAMARDVARALASGGLAVLSGLVCRDGPWLAAAYRQVGLRLSDAVTIDGWRTLVVGRRPSSDLPPSTRTG